LYRNRASSSLRWWLSGGCISEYDGENSVVNVVIFCVTLIFLMLLLYPVADLRYHRSMGKRHNQDQVHPFLQLAPVVEGAGLDQASDSFRIFCLGGSTTEFADSSGRDWPSRVEENLRKRLGRSDIRVLNCGRQWYTTLHMLILYESSLRQYRPDAIVLMETINDLLVNAFALQRRPFQFDYGHFYGPRPGITSMGICLRPWNFWGMLVF
jgi:hypothetical protein